MSNSNIFIEFQDELERKLCNAHSRGHALIPSFLLQGWKELWKLFHTKSSNYKNIVLWIRNYIISSMFTSQLQSVLTMIFILSIR